MGHKLQVQDKSCSSSLEIETTLLRNQFTYAVSNALSAPFLPTSVSPKTSEQTCIFLT